MELQEIKPRNLTDKIVESMSEAEAEAIYENPYSTHIYHNFGGSIIPARNYFDDQLTDETIFHKIGKRKWSLLHFILGLFIGGTVVGLSMHFIVCTTAPETASEKTRHGE